METFEQIFLQIIHDACTNKTSSIDIAPQDMDALLALAKDQSCVPYVLPYLNDKNRLEPLKYQTKLISSQDELLRFLKQIRFRMFF